MIIPPRVHTAIVYTQYGMAVILPGSTYHMRSVPTVNTLRNIQMTVPAVAPKGAQNIRSFSVLLILLVVSLIFVPLKNKYLLSAIAKRSENALQIYLFYKKSFFISMHQIDRIQNLHKNVKNHVIF